MNINEQQKGGQPGQTQEHQPGVESKMNPLPIQPMDYVGSGKLKDRVAIITGGDSGIGRAVAVAYAKEGANIVINYLDEDGDAEETKKMIEDENVKCLLIQGDISQEETCKKLIDDTLKEFNKIDIVVSNAAVQYPVDSITDITTEQWKKTFAVNMDPLFYLSKFAVPHLKEGSSIIATTSINPYKGNKQLIDYTSTKGAIVGFVRSLAQNVVGQGIRVNMVAPGPIWTPLIPSSFDEKAVEQFGTESLMKRPGQPRELVGAYVLLASDDASYMTGQCIHVNGGEIMHS
ncbi:SDR family oxidoreductase [Rummeliibacillus sp. G93]|uniref:NAD(P)-dependent oxidoreductase n=1 Tax=Rummeliibacillus stabekisii TaxID=241244 RepID=A0A143HG58_9BACL|nr:MULTISPECIES: SDR family oxidoreductase [Rummeliibacillus]AMX00719.1 NAD(P)-dependent oxidoreductase [Rummeliibacillus stabekisii]MCM3318172.1 SDR family oxidoreductase [Rummeliibacillus stabekisii]UQW97561.1 SDR family oxidoreductase [Rummeliibacillus sp. G93]